MMLKRVFAMVVIFSMLFTGIVQGAGDVEKSGIRLFSDVNQQHWASNDIAKWTTIGLLEGYPDGTFKPNNYLSRAEFCAVVNKVFGYYEKSSEDFEDVDPTKWYAAVASKANAAGYTKSWVSTFKPNLPVTRKEVALALSYAFKLSKVNTSEYLNKFTDMKDYKGIGANEIASILANGFMSGYPDKTFKPDANITRAEFTGVLSNSVEKLYNTAGSYIASEIKGNVIINTTGVILKDTKIEGNIYLSEGIGEGDVTLDNVTVEGKTIISGGGKNSIHLNNSIFSEISVDKKNGIIRIVSSSSLITNIILRSGTIFESSQTDLKTLPSIIIDGDIPAGQIIEIFGNVDSIICKSPGVIIKIAKDAVVNSLKIEESAKGTSLKVEGKVAKAEINATDIKINDKPVQKGAKGTINGTSGELPVVSGGSSNPSSSTPPEQAQLAATPTFNPAGGTFDALQNVIISSATEGATIRYTIDGTTPSGISAIYSGPIAINTTSTIKAIAIKSGKTNSNVATATYNINIPVPIEKVATPTLNPAGGTFDALQNVTISCATEGATIRYTIDGTTPSDISAIYSGPISVNTTSTIKAIAIKSGKTNSDVATATYTINITVPIEKVATPTFNPAGGTFDALQNVIISSATEGATIRYTIDGTTPSGISAIYSGPISVNTTSTIKAIAIESGKTNSDVAAATYTISIPQENPWTMVWNDEFDGTTLDITKWRLENKGDGFGNNEEQYYRPENATVKDGNLVIQAKKETFGGRNYTSAKLFSKADWKYGKFEASIKLPLGAGYWPAFWMMPADSKYGVWAASGEIDIMEAKGRLPGTTSGTLHYGATYPNNKYTGAEQVFPEGQTIDQFHTYSVEWEPGEIRWYVDGNLFQTQNNWSTTGANGDEKYAFPAPFDENFYLMLNLAIGGNFDGGIIPADSTFPAQMEVDYVRAYELTGRPYKTVVEPNIPKEALPPGARQPDTTGNLIKDINFEQMIKENAQGVDAEFGEVWNFVHNPEFAGVSTAVVEAIGATNYAKVNVTNVGTQPYSTQLEQLTTLGKGRWYKYSFDAKADKSRTLSTKLGGGPTRGWAAYSDSYTENLTTEVKSFEHIFQMTRDTDILTRLEYNCATDTGPVWIGNVRVEEIDQPLIDYSGSKDPLAVSENRIYNGAFDKYTIDRMAYWNVTKSDSDASITVPEDKRELTAYITNGGADAGAITVDQKGIQLVANSKYILTFKARSDADRTIKLKVSSKDGIIDYITEKEITLTTATDVFEVPFTIGVTEDLEAQLIFMLGGNNADVYIDDVVLLQTTRDYTNVDLFPLKNGEFTLGLANWEPFTQGAAATFSVVNGEAKVAVTSVGVDNWGIMLNQGKMSFSKGIEYELSFDARATVARDIEVTVENATYVRSFQTGSLDLTTDMKHFSYTFKPAASDTLALKFLLGNTTKYAAGDIYIDNVVLQVKNSPVKRPVALNPDTTNNKVGQLVEILFNDDPAWRAAISDIKINGVTLLDNQFTLEAGKLVLMLDNFITDQNYTILIEAEGYASTSVMQQIFANDGNLIFNGKFNTTSSWEFWNNVTDWSSYTIENGVAAVKINYHGAKENEWKVPFSWSTQFKQSDIKLEAGKTYELTFKAWSTVAMPIQVELTGYNNGEKTNFNISSDQTAIYKKGITGANVTMKVDFLLGYVENGATVTPDGEHTIFIDDVSIKEVVTAPKLTADKVDNTVGQAIEITFADNQTWRNVITAVKVEGALLANGNYSVTAGKISINSSVFTAIKEYTISVEATGFSITQVIQPVKTAAANLALGKTSTASSEKQAAKNAFDGNIGTRWESNSTETEWVAVDLGGIYNLSSIAIYWEGARSADYKIQVSTTDVPTVWTDIYSTTSKTGSLDEITLTGQEARHVRMYGTKRALPYGHSIWEMEIYGALKDVEQPKEVATPTLSPAGGTFNTLQNVTISCVTEGATIRYTIDGTTPSSTSSIYSGPITVSTNTTIKAIAIQSGKTNSDVAAATYTISIPQENPWTMVWNDEFDGTTLDITKWRLENKGDGFGNNEEQYYRPENATVKDGNLVIQAKKETFGGRNYTSAKLFSKADWKYGKFEASIKLPLGAGYWPAFWMMPADSKYGVWAASGEIDIMEAKGRLPGTTSGTIHYGAVSPNNKYTGDDQVFPEGQTIDQFHTYSIEWEPGEIRWYVDGNLFQTQNNWSTTGSNRDEKYAFPAPFDENFYLMLNLAIGGNFDGNIIPADSTFPAQMEVDYVRAYELTGRPYKTVTEPIIPKDVLPAGARQPDATGNLLKDINFDNGIKENAEGVDAEFGEVWNFIHNAQFAGVATVNIEKIGEINFAKVNVTDKGNQTYSVQLEQQTTLGKGRWYKYSFDAKADKSRTLSTKLGGGPTGGWAAYSDSYTENLTTEVKSFEHIFQMTRDTDILTRLEYNCATDTGTVWIGNVKVVEVDAPAVDYNASKGPLASSGNNIYNGAFDKYAIDRMTYWNVTKTGATATLSVPETTRELTANIIDGVTNASSITVDQKGLQLQKGNGYSLTFKARADADRTIKVKLTSKDGTSIYMPEKEIALTTTMQEIKVLFTMAAENDLESQLVFMLGGNNADVFIDDVALIQTTVDYTGVELYPLKNGDFSLGFTRWEKLAIEGGAADFSIENGAAEINITNVGGQVYSIMLNQGNMEFKRGMEYELSFDAKASVARDIDVSIENSTYARRLNKPGVTLATEMTNFKYDFKITADEILALKIMMGNTAKAATGIVYIDNVVLQVKDAPTKKPPTLGADITDNKVGYAVAVLFNEDAEWRGNISAIKLEGNVLTTGYTMEAGKLTLDATNFPVDKGYTIFIEANGYAPTSVVQPILANDGNLILNGDMSKGNANWVLWNYGDNSPNISSITFENGTVNINIKDHGPQNWSTQFYQEGIKLESGKTYELSFKGRASATCPIQIELSNYNAQQFNIILTDTDTVHKKSFTASKDALLKLNYLLGNIINGDVSTPAGEHTIYIDDVSLKEMTPAPVLMADNTENKLGHDIDITFTDNADWREKITAVNVDGTIVTSSALTITSGDISIDSSVFTTAKSYTIAVAATGYGVAEVTQIVKENVLDAPEFTADSTNNRVGQAIEITFSDNVTWRNSIHSVKLNGSTIDGSLYSVTSGAITITSSAISVEGSYAITIEADGYATPSVSQIVMAEDGNLLINGDMSSGIANWGNYTGDGSNASISVIDGALAVNFPNYDGWFKWSTQITQSDLKFEAGKTYVLTFDIKSTLVKPIIIKLEKVTGGIVYKEITDVALTSDMQNCSYEFIASEAAVDGKLYFMLGSDNVPGESFKTHTVTIDNVKIIEKK